MNMYQESTSIFAEYASYYDLLYQDKDYKGEVDYVNELIHRFHPDPRTILELGSGTGVHAMHFAKNGYEITGIEISTDMIQIAQTKINNLPSDGPFRPFFVQGDIRSVHLKHTYDVVIALFHVMSYQTTNKDIMAAFETAKKHLRPGGVFIFDIWYGPAVLTDRPSVRIKRMSDEHIFVTRIAEPIIRANDSVVEVHYHIFIEDLKSRIIKQLSETHIMRYLFKTEIELLAVKKGLHIMHAEEWLTGKPISESTWSACFILKA